MVIKKVIKSVLIIVLSVAMWVSVMLSIIARNKEETNISFDRKTQINNIYVDGVRENLSLYQLEKNNDGYITDNINLKKSKISDLYIDVSCQEKEIGVSVNDKTYALCKENNKQSDSLYIGNDLDVILSNYIVNLESFELIKVILIGIAFLLLNTLLFHSFNKIIKLMNQGSFKIKNMLLVSVLLFITYLFCFNYILWYLHSFIIIPISLIVVFLLCKIKDKISEFREYAFFIIGLFAGLTFLFLIPPLHVPDEDQHFIKVYASSNFNNYHITTDDYGHYFIYLNTDTHDFVNKYSFDKLTYNAKYKPIGYISDYFNNKSDNMSESMQLYALNSYKFSAYIPAIIVCMILRLLTISPILISYCCRFTNLLLFLMVVFYAIKKVPIFKNLFFFMALLPLSIHSAVGINQDSINNSLFILLLCILLRLIYEKEYKLNIKRLLLILLISILMFCCKKIYIAILLLLLLVPKEKYSNLMNNKVIKKFFMMLVILFTVIVCFFVNRIGGIKGGLTPLASRDYYTIANVISNPLHFVKIICNTIEIRFTLDFFRGFFDGYGWSTVWNKDIIRDLLFIIYTIALLCCSSQNNKISKKHHLLNWSIIFIIVGCLCFGMLFYWTNNTYSFIDGLQPRYFIPVAYILYSEVASFNIVSVDENYKNRLLIFMMSIGLLLSCITLINGFTLSM